MRTLVVDAYNVIHAQPRLAELLQESQEAAREGLLQELAPLTNPESYDLIMVVFDAAASSQAEPVVEDRAGLTLVYTRRGQSADSFIEIAVKHLVREGPVEISTNDRDLIALSTGFGAGRLRPEELMVRAAAAREGIRREIDRLEKDGRSRLEDRIGEEVRQILDSMRYG
jgi:hypothetical protein